MKKPKYNEQLQQIEGINIIKHQTIHVTENCLGDSPTSFGINKSTT